MSADDPLAADAAAGPDPGSGGADGATDGATAEPMTVEDLIDALEQVTTQRDEYLDSLQRLQAEFENFRRRSHQEAEQRIAAGLGQMAEAMLPVLDACDVAISQGVDGVDAIRSSLELALEKEGLERIPAAGEPFDPTHHEAVLHEQGDQSSPTVVEELRSGYRWKGRVLRAAMVKVSG